MGFEDELTDIVQSILHGESDADVRPLNIALDKVRAEGTDSYLVFMTADGENGLITLGNKSSLSLLHRIADHLIDRVVYDNEH